VDTHESLGLGHSNEGWHAAGDSGAQEHVAAAAAHVVANRSPHRSTATEARNELGIPPVKATLSGALLLQMATVVFNSLRHAAGNKDCQ
jgi:hypothetical protein